MRAAIVEGAGRPLVLADVPDPTPGPGELVLRVRAAGLCGTDLHLAGDPLIVPPGTVLGHEFAGEVAALGAGVEGGRPGERVSALPVIGCTRCAACLAGDTMGCPGVRMLGAGDLPGAFAEYVRVGARETMRLPEALDPLPGRRALAYDFGATATVDASDPLAMRGVPDLLPGGTPRRLRVRRSPRDARPVRGSRPPAGADRGRRGLHGAGPPPPRDRVSEGGRPPLRRILCAPGLRAPRARRRTPSRRRDGDQPRATRRAPRGVRGPACADHGLQGDAQP
jgi:hypothetical protein